MAYGSPNIFYLEKTRLPPGFSPHTLKDRIAPPAPRVAGCDRFWPGCPVRISAQAHLQRFYGAFGFAPVGEEYLEDNIPHIEMVRRPA